MRRAFHPILAGFMQHDIRIHLVIGDLGYGMWDTIAASYPDRFHNVGASEQLAVGAAVGLALSGCIPVVYSITPFLLWRAAEWHRNYLEHEGIAVKLLAGGRDRDYAHDGFTHDATDDKQVLSLFPRIVPFWPASEEELSFVAPRWLYNGQPSYLNLKR